MDTLLSKSFAVPSEDWIKEKSATRSSHDITNHYIGDDIALATFYVVVSFPFFLEQVSVFPVFPGWKKNI